MNFNFVVQIVFFIPWMSLSLTKFSVVPVNYRRIKTEVVIRGVLNIYILYVVSVNYMF